MGNAAVFVIARSADFKPAEKLLAFAAQRPRDSRLPTISWRSWPPCDYGESTTTKHPVGFVTGITKPLTQHNPVLNIRPALRSAPHNGSTLTSAEVEVNLTDFIDGGRYVALYRPKLIRRMAAGD